jgi:energy-converting hydrogenase Eha subunit E
MLATVHGKAEISFIKASRISTFIKMREIIHKKGRER